MGQDVLQNLIFDLFRQDKYAVSVDIEDGMFLQVGVLARDQISLRFCGGSIPLLMW